VLLDSVVRTSVSDGWRVVPVPPRKQLLGTPDLVLQRGSMLRELQIVRFDDERGMLQLWDVPESLFGPPDRSAQ
jgi:hypothetical protein